MNHLLHMEAEKLLSATGNDSIQAVATLCRLIAENLQEFATGEWHKENRPKANALVVRARSHIATLSLHLSVKHLSVGIYTPAFSKELAEMMEQTFLALEFIIWE